MAEAVLLTHRWLAPCAWALLYTSDYYLTLRGARLAAAQTTFVFEGSYEMTPGFQRDIDQRRRVSWRHIVLLIWGFLVLLGAGFVAASAPLGPPVYGALVGMFLLPELAIHVRHLVNIATFTRAGLRDAGVSGRVEYARRYMHHISAAQFFAWTLFSLAAAALSLSWTLVGGSIALGLIALRHWGRAGSE